jgi:hypothetical protein
MRRPARIVLTITLATVLAGCSTPTPTPAPTATPTTTPTTAGTSTAPPTTPAAGATSTPPQTPAPAPAPDVSGAPARLVISSLDIQIVLADGTVAQTISYFDGIEPAVSTITELLDATPTVNTYDGTGAADYDWPGLSLGTDGPARPPTKAELYVTATVDQINDLQLETTDGLQVGDDLRPLAEAAPENTHVGITSAGTEMLFVDVESVPIDTSNPDRAFHTGLTANPTDGLIAQIHAPEKNFE